MKEIQVDNLIESKSSNQKNPCNYSTHTKRLKENSILS